MDGEASPKCIGDRVGRLGGVPDRRGRRAGPGRCAEGKLAKAHDRIIPEPQTRVVESDLQDQDKLNLLLHMKNFQAPRPNFLGSDWARMKLRALGQVNKYAVVGGPAWMDAIISFFDPIIKMDMRTFQEDELDKAWEWLRE